MEVLDNKGKILRLNYFISNFSFVNANGKYSENSIEMMGEKGYSWAVQRGTLDSIKCPSQPDLLVTYSERIR